MPNSFLDARDRWIDLSEVDYLGHFVRAWLAFNAWYRSAYSETQDRAIIENIKWQPNPIRSKLLPLIDGATADAAEFRANIGLLHERLDGYRIETGKGADKTPITLRKIYLKSQVQSPKNSAFMGWTYSVRPGTANGSVVSEVKDASGATRFTVSQPKYDLPGIEGRPDFASSLNSSQQGRLRGLYIQFLPHLVADVTNRKEPGWKPIRVGAVDIECPPPDLFAAVVEVVYLMRCALFHGELIPTKDAGACYEPAYRIVRRCIGSIS
ncbi:MAG: hypothetical protein O3B84_06480 [Chloroflexi bacterium]|nr:hypothetical protein [Chloroflexota bacterium]